MKFGAKAAFGAAAIACAAFGAAGSAAATDTPNQHVFDDLGYMKIGRIIIWNADHTDFFAVGGIGHTIPGLFYTDQTPSSTSLNLADYEGEELIQTPTAPGLLGYLYDPARGNLYYAGATRDSVYSFETIPEPTTWALMLAGFGLAGSGLREARRRATD